jgi:hypothetical protein
LKGPGGHHRNGGLYEVNIRLAPPSGRRVPHRQTNGIPTLTLLSTMPLSGRVGACRTVCAECKAK